MSMVAVFSSTENFASFSVLSLTRLKMAVVDVDSLSSMSAIALTAVVGAVVLLLIFLCNFVKKGFEKSRIDPQGVPPTFFILIISPYLNSPTP